MPQFTNPIMPIIALATSITAFSLPQGASAETCLSGPKGAAPQGSHWKYRLERGTQRKCWRLVQVDRKGETAARATAQGDADEEADDTPAPAAKPQAATPPAAKKRAEPVATVPATNQGWVTKDASENIEASEPAAPPAAAAEVPATATPADMALAPAPAPQMSAPAEAANAAPAPLLAVEQPAPKPMPASDAASTASGGSFFTRFLLAAIATLGLLAFAAFYVLSLWRRRTDVLTKAQHLNNMPYEMSASRDAPTFAPLPPMELMPQQADDLDIAMERFSTSWRRRAA